MMTTVSRDFASFTSPYIEHMAKFDDDGVWFPLYWPAHFSEVFAKEASGNLRPLARVHLALGGDGVPTGIADKVRELQKAGTTIVGNKIRHSDILRWMREDPSMNEGLTISPYKPEVFQ